jgi:hypothetical protein
MIRTRTFMLVLALAVGAAGCSDDDDPVGPQDPLERFVGTWNASSFVYTSVDNPAISIPILEAVQGSSVSVTVAGDGGFLAQINLGAQTGGQTVPVPGTIDHVSGDASGNIVVTFAPNPFFTEPLQVAYNFQTQNTLSWSAPTTFDFNQDGTPTAATLSVVFQRN